MIHGFFLAISAHRAVFLSQVDLVLENLALRQQLAAFARNGSASPHRCRRPTGLARPAKALVAMVRRARLRETRDSGPLAPSQFSSLLDLALAAPPSRSTANRCPPPRIDTSDGVGEDARAVMLRGFLLAMGALRATLSAFASVAEGPNPVWIRPSLRAGPTARRL